MPELGAMVALAKEQGLERVYVHAEDATEASLIEGIEVLPVTTLRQLVMHLNSHPLAAGTIVPYVAEPPGEEVADGHQAVDIGDIKGQEHLKRALEEVATGEHNCLLFDSAHEVKKSIQLVICQIQAHPRMKVWGEDSSQ